MVAPRLSKSCLETATGSRGTPRHIVDSEPSATMLDARTLKNVGHFVSRGTVANVLAENGIVRAITLIPVS